MPYDERLAARVRALLADRTDVDERRMFGGLTFMVGGNMCCGVHRDELIVRLDPDREDEALAEPHARPMDLTGRRMRSFITVRPAGLKGNRLNRWVQQAVDRAESQSPKVHGRTRGLRQSPVRRTRGGSLAAHTPASLLEEAPKYKMELLGDSTLLFRWTDVDDLDVEEYMDVVRRIAARCEERRSRSVVIDIRRRHVDVRFDDAWWRREILPGYQRAGVERFAHVTGDPDAPGEWAEVPHGVTFKMGSFSDLEDALRSATGVAPSPPSGEPVVLVGAVALSALQAGAVVALGMKAAKRRKLPCR